ncbi:hypothetical protein WA026_020536 [Henosepilachna vigintioctopunctata]|uniref:LAGLIDADG homing endonuclease n=1 Tax=Henosepilachna vigintioctopunctata TaxID=420089 RepID=A0AAW1VBH8_9CUCU
MYKSSWYTVSVVCGHHISLHLASSERFVTGCAKPLGFIKFGDKEIQVFIFCEKYELKHNFTKDIGLASKDWLKMFLKRHPEIPMRKAQFINAVRAQKLNRIIEQETLNEHKVKRKTTQKISKEKPKNLCRRLKMKKRNDLMVIKEKEAIYS